jgi:TRAP-type C4-dicarboxylate transport system permease small subunit
MGFAIALKSASHIQFRFLFERLPQKTQRVVALAYQILALSFFIFVIWGGYKHFIHMTPSMLPIMGISEKWAVLPVPLSALIMAIHVLEMIMQSIGELFTNDAI